VADTLTSTMDLRVLWQTVKVTLINQAHQIYYNGKI
jgi:hypothetical protein